MPPAPAMARRLLPLLLAASVAFGAGCAAPPVRVVSDPGIDLAALETWSWRPNVTATLQSPGGSSSPLNTMLADVIERELTSRGYVHRSGAPDLVVAYGLDLQRRMILAQVPRAPYLLSSLSSGASYWVEGTDLERQQVHDVTITVELADFAGRVVWSAESTTRLHRGQKIDVDATVVSLLEALPQRRGTAGAPAPGGTPPRGGSDLP